MTEEIKNYFPDFYESNKEKIDNGKIMFFGEMYATETGVLVDLETTETIFVDFRS